MTGIARKGDPLKDCDGIVYSSLSSSVFINGEPAAIKGTLCNDHSPYGPAHSPHVPNEVITSTTSIFIEGYPVALKGDSFHCGHVIATGSDDVLAGDGGSASPVAAPGASAMFGSFPPNSPAVLSSEQKRNNITSEHIWEQGINAPLADTNGDPQGKSDLPPMADGIIPFLDAILTEADQGKWSRTWKETGQNNPNIMRLFRDLGHTWPQNDSVPWCAAFVNFVLKRTGYNYTNDLGAISFTSPDKWKATAVTDISGATPGDIVVWEFKPGSNHVNFVYSNTGGRLTFCGGNQTGADLANNNPKASRVTRNYSGGWTLAQQKPGVSQIIKIIRPSK